MTHPCISGLTHDYETDSSEDDEFHEEEKGLQGDGDSGNLKEHLLKSLKPHHMHHHLGASFNMVIPRNYKSIGNLRQLLLSN